MGSDRSVAGARGAGRGEGRREDRRVRRSKRAIVDAFDRLIMTKPLEEITVSAIAREADVDRKTFYQHYGSIDGILDAIAETIVTDLLDSVEEATWARQEASPSEPGLCAGEGLPDQGESALSDFFEALTKLLSQNLVLWQRYYEHVPADLMFDRLSRLLAEQVSRRRLVGSNLSGVELDMVLSFSLGGLFSLYRWWLLSGQAVPVEEVVRRASQLVRDGVSSLA